MTFRYLGVEDDAVTSMAAVAQAADTTITVTDASVFGAAEIPFTITVANELETIKEIMLVTDVAGNVLTVQRGYKYAPQVHQVGFSVSLRVIAQHIDDLNDNSVMQIQQSCHVEHTKNGNGQVILTEVWEDDSKTVLIADTAYTFSNTRTKIPATAVRTIYEYDGVATRRTESTTFTVIGGEVTVLNRVVS